MAEPEHDDLADALARMAAADFSPGDIESVPPKPTVRADKPVTNRPVTSRPATVKPTAAPPPVVPPAKPSAPVTRARPAAPTLASAPAPAAPSPPRTPAPPVIAPANARKARPAAPTTRSATVPNEPAEINGAPSTGLSDDGNAVANDGQVIDDDDSVIVPAPDPSVFNYQSKKVTSDARAKVLRQKNLNYLRTLIPILFTFGVLMIGSASLKFLSGEDSTLAAMPIWIPGMLIFGALIFFGFMAMCMVVVRKMMSQS